MSEAINSPSELTQDGLASMEGIQMETKLNDRGFSNKSLTAKLTPREMFGSLSRLFQLCKLGERPSW